ncbi:winged helix-turn-helix transcriptional regulator [Hydrogenoanaerobacterium sp.]|uniref:winged helix-turn-helix transcriptional regulator n=1 Tax=Hydrogenoanaerobacterium sp. TaxID=2953763 RepID=UPI00289ED4A3|nr:winged helix-turn-helix transcriptional regulator [Hydrogenoanaerobacterium sp.]
MKRRNRQIILNTILHEGGMSRTELAQATELSPSTVSVLVSELLEEELLVETGVTISTGGRSRIEVAINRNYGIIGVVEIGRNGASLHLFDMALERMTDVQLASHYITGNELLIAITAAVFEHCGGEKLRAGRLAGLGLLFQEDMQSGEFNVMYSTSLSSATISLREALLTQFRIPVTEEYTQVYSMANALAQAENTPAKNSAYISIGERVLAGITLEGQPLTLREGARTDITPLFQSIGENLPSLTAAEEITIQTEEQTLPALRQAQGWLALLAQQLAVTVAMLCTLFPLEAVLLSGMPARCTGFVDVVRGLVTRSLAPREAPAIQAVQPAACGQDAVIAAKIRQTVLCCGV